jgi:hypothetical protein
VLTVVLREPPWCLPATGPSLHRRKLVFSSAMLLAQSAKCRGSRGRAPEINCQRVSVVESTVRYRPHRTTCLKVIYC